MGYNKIYLSVQKQSEIHVQYSENHLQNSMKILFEKDKKTGRGNAFFAERKSCLQVYYQPAF